MIKDDKDRFECLKLAASILIPKHQVPPEQAATAIVSMAEKFYKFVTSEGGPNEPR